MMFMKQDLNYLLRQAVVPQCMNQQVNDAHCPCDGFAALQHQMV